VPCHTTKTPTTTASGNTRQAEVYQVPRCTPPICARLTPAH
jgi:hypothetical protein